MVSKRGEEEKKRKEKMLELKKEVRDFVFHFNNAF